MKGNLGRGRLYEELNRMVEDTEGWRLSNQQEDLPVIKAEHQEEEALHAELPTCHFQKKYYWAWKNIFLG